MNCGMNVPEYANAGRVQPSELLPLGLGPFSMSFQDQSNWHLGRCPHCEQSQIATVVRWRDPQNGEQCRCMSCGGDLGVTLIYTTRS